MPSSLDWSRTSATQQNPLQHDVFRNWTDRGNDAFRGPLPHDVFRAWNDHPEQHGQT